jgi:integrase
VAQPKIKPIKIGDKTRYRFVVDVGTDPKTGKRKQLTRTYDGKRVAEKELAKILDKVNVGSYVRSDKQTLGEYLDEWIRSATRGRAASTVEAYTNALKPARDQLGAKLVQKVTTADVEDLMDWMLTAGRKRGGKVGTGLSPRCAQLTLSKLRAALDSAVHRRMVEFNVAAPVKCPAQVKVKRVPWSPAEVKTFLASLVGHRLKAVLLLSLMGLRPAEVCGLRWDEDIDLDGQTLTIANTRTIVWSAGGGRVVEKPPKSAAGNRELPLPAPVVAALKAFRTLQARERLAAGEAYEVTGYVLVDELGQPCRTDWLRRRTYELMATAKVRKVRPYDARHSCLTYLATHGVPDVIVSAWAGHADLTTAKRVYVHPSAADLEQGRDALNTLLG